MVSPLTSSKNNKVVKRGGGEGGLNTGRGRKLQFIIHVMRNIISTVLFWNELLMVSWKLYVKTCIWECPDGQSEGPGMAEADLKIIC